MREILIFLILVIADSASASSSYMNSGGTGRVQQAILNEYGADAGANTTSCRLCHSTESGGFGTINSGFGLDFDTAGGTNGLSVSNLQVVLRSFEDDDSDNDGFTNREEFLAKSNPNNANDNENSPQSEQGSTSSSSRSGDGGGGCGAIITNSSGPKPPFNGLLLALFLLPLLVMYSVRSHPRTV